MTRGFATVREYVRVAIGFGTVLWIILLFWALLAWLTKPRSDE